MQSSAVIKWLHRLVTAALALFVSAVVLSYYDERLAPNDALFAQRKIAEGLYLYVTQYRGGNTTVSDVYRYYLDGEPHADVLNNLKKRHPFLTADIGNATVTGYGAHVNVRITGRVYSFTNSDLFYANGAAVMPVISITANGVP